MSDEIKTETAPSMPADTGGKPSNIPPEEMSRLTDEIVGAAEVPVKVENAGPSVSGVREAKVNIVWDPPWDPSRMSDEARTVLNMW
jgi:hypothetical protein